MSATRTVITGTGSYIPPMVKTNADFMAAEFYDEDHQLLITPAAEIVEKFKDITGIEERRYASNEINSSDMAFEAAKLAIADAGIDPETIDQIIFAHNFGNVLKDTIQTDVLPALASRVKHQLGIRNPACVAYDILFGCPGWMQGVIQGLDDCIIVDTKDVLLICKKEKEQAIKEYVAEVKRNKGDRYL